MTLREAYRILGLSPGADRAELKKRYRQLMVRLHPDVQTAVEEDYRYSVSEINGAYARLKRELESDGGVDGAGKKEQKRRERTAPRSQAPGRRAEKEQPHCAEWEQRRRAAWGQQSKAEHGQRESTAAGQQRQRKKHWNGPVNIHAYREREIFCHAEDGEGNSLGLFSVARGKYLWSMEEEFPLFLYSVYQCGKEILEELDERDAYRNERQNKRRDAQQMRTQAFDRPEDFFRPEDFSRPADEFSRRQKIQAELTYLLAQQFIHGEAMLAAFAREECGEGEKNKEKAAEPAEEKGERIFFLSAMLERTSQGKREIRGKAGKRVSQPPEPREGEALYPSRLSSHRLFLKDKSGRELGYLSFPDDRLYYIVIPLFEQRRVQVKVRAASCGRLQLWLKLPAFCEGGPPENLNQQIEMLLKGYR